LNSIIGICDEKIKHYRALFEKAMAQDEEKKSFADLWEAFTSFPSLPMLEDEDVLKPRLSKESKKWRIWLNHRRESPLRGTGIRRYNG